MDADADRTPWDLRERSFAVASVGLACLGVVAFAWRPAFPLPVTDVASWLPSRIPQVNWDGLYLASAASSVLRTVLLLLLVATHAGRRVLRAATGWMSGTVIGAAMAVVNVLAFVDLMTLPIAWWGRVSSKDGPTWLAEWFIEHAQTWALVGLLAAALIISLERWPRGWRWRLVLACVALAALVPLGADLDPFSGRSAPLPDGAVRQAVDSAQTRAGIVRVPVEVGSGSAASELGAYVTGLGPSTKIVLSSALVEGFAPGRVAFVAMHEYAHRENLDVYRKVLGTAAGALVAVWILHLVITTAPVRRQVAGARAPHARLAIIALAVVTVVHTFASPVSNLASRRSEAAADWQALEATADPESAIAMQRFLVRQGAVDPSPPAWYQAWLGTYPTPSERIGLAVRYAELNGIQLNR